MRRLGLMLLLVVACEGDFYVWDDASGIEVCEEVADECGQLEGPDLFEACGDAVRDRAGLVDRVPGLHRRLTADVLDGRRDTCGDAMAYLAAWRIEP